VRKPAGKSFTSLQNVEEHQVREVLKCVIHTIIFNRALGHVSPRDMDLQLINISYVEAADDDIERLVEDGLRKVDEFFKTLKPRSSSSSGTVRAVLLDHVYGRCL
jgi:autophagy-related protein 101